MIKPLQRKTKTMRTFYGIYCNTVGIGKGSTVETLYSTIYYSKYFIELNIDKSTQYVALWTHKRHPIPRPFGRAMECLLWVLQQKLIVLKRVSTVLPVNFICYHLITDRRIEATEPQWLYPFHDHVSNREPRCLTVENIKILDTARKYGQNVQ